MQIVTDKFDLRNQLQTVISGTYLFLTYFPAVKKCARVKLTIINDIVIRCYG